VNFAANPGSKGNGSALLGIGLLNVAAIQGITVAIPDDEEKLVTFLEKYGKEKAKDICKPGPGNLLFTHLESLTSSRELLELRARKIQVSAPPERGRVCARANPKGQIEEYLVYLNELSMVGASFIRANGTPPTSAPRPRASDRDSSSAAK
jgi:hypothetical protein